MRLAFFSTLAIAILATACGRTTSDSGSEVAATGGSTAASGGRTFVGGGSAGDAGKAGGPGSTDFTSLCPEAGWPDSSQPVAVGFTDAEVVVVRADGSQRVVATLGQSAGIAASEMTRVSVSTPDGAIVWAQWPSPTQAERTDGETVLLDHAGEVIWQLPGVVVNTWSGLPNASPAGMVAYALGQNKLVQADGTSSDLPLGDYDSVSFVGNVASDGWLAALWWFNVQGGQDWHYGFLNLDGRPPREFVAKPIFDDGLRTFQGQAYYLSDRTSPLFYLETPGETRSIALGIEPGAASTFSAWSSASRIVVSVDQRLARIVDPVSGTVSAVDTAAIDAIVGTDSLGNPQWYEVRSMPGSDFAIGGDYETPKFLLDTRSGAALPVRLDLLDLGLLDSPYCGDVLALDDGRIGLGLRDPAVAGFYLGNADGTGFERLGLPFRDVTAIRADRVAGSWVLTGVSGIDSYCTPFEPFAAATSGDPPALEGDVVQIVAPGAAPLVLPGPPPIVQLDATGLCALATWPGGDPGSSETRLYDVTIGTSTRLDGLTSVTWL